MTASPTLLERVLADPAGADEVTERILDAAAARFEVLGLQRTTMEDVARAARLGRATIYRRFAGKDDLVEAVLLRELRRVVTEVRVRLLAVPTLEEQLVEGFVATLRAVREHPLLARLLEVEPELLLPYLTVGAGPGIALARDLLAAHIREMQRRGRAPAFEPEPLAELLVRLCHSLFLTPEGVIPSEDDESSRAFARAYVVPLLDAAAAHAR